MQIWDESRKKTSHRKFKYDKNQKLKVVKLKNNTGKALLRMQEGRRKS
jgi:hypothetical protein